MAPPEEQEQEQELELELELEQEEPEAEYVLAATLVDHPAPTAAASCCPIPRSPS